ncbi:hypothetical protein EV421DRAFT_2035164 [Armillaria borealis]|uniref:Uncharacterized protein n=1 Tax=Armillaria borealis TaxID=47425 RepID=A0AA39JLY4_9AGAR|nr:hypothetical protein EV421DRAFT_2035164 [Armillaria borealis]
MDAERALLGKRSALHGIPTRLNRIRGHRRFQRCLLQRFIYRPRAWPKLNALVLPSQGFTTTIAGLSYRRMPRCD